METDAASYPTQRGSPVPFGVSRKDQLINFSLFSENATGVSLCLFTPGHQTPFIEIPLNPQINRTGDLWHISVGNLPTIFEWGYKIYSQDKAPTSIVSDPYSKELNTPVEWGSPFYASNLILSKWNASFPYFDWENEVPPNIAMKDLIIYEMHVRGFTKDPSSQTKNPGSFEALIEKIPYLQELGINAIELLPIFEFNECENHLKNSKTGEPLYNFWGYSTVNFFSLMRRYTRSSNPIGEFKTLVKELHKNKIEIILDVVYNHSAEGNEKGPNFSFREIDKAAYYILGPEGEYLNFSGCGNTFNCNHPVTMELIIDSLHYWAGEMHVDGFRFDLASILTRDTSGYPMIHPPLIESISKDPILANCKIIAEAWDAAGLYQVGNFPSFGRWAEWNGKYRDTVRKFIKGTEGQAGDVAKMVSGSQNLYGSSRTPCHSINFVIAHDGFTLKDLVSYNQKHNEENGEHNHDGMNDNESWNCGQEGETTNPKIIQLRERQMRNFHTMLMVSLGTPMLYMGDEYGHTRNGNNNAWCHDNVYNWFQWNLLTSSKEFFRFYKQLIAFRKNEPLLRREEFLKKEEVDWHGHTPLHPDWSAKSKFIAYTLKDLAKENHLYIAFNAQDDRPSIQLPLPPSQKKWYRIVDTALASPDDFSQEPSKFAPLKASYKMEAYSALIAKAF